jgi:hypothetical protein
VGESEGGGDYVIEFLLILTCGELHDGGEEGHWVEEVGDADRFGHNHILGPLHELLVAELEVIVPGGEGFLGGVVLSPTVGDSVEHEGDLEGFHGIGHVEGTLETEIEFVDGSEDILDEVVHALAFLQAHYIVGSGINLACIHFVLNLLEVDLLQDDLLWLLSGGLGGLLLLILVDYGADVILLTTRGAGASLNIEDRREEGLCLLSEVIDLRVGMKSEHFWGFGGG